MEHVIEADGVGKRYGGRWALRDCTVRLPAGRVAALVGPNRAGKSTLLHLAVGLLRPNAGMVRVFGAAPVREHDRPRGHRLRRPGHAGLSRLHRR